MVLSIAVAVRLVRHCDVSSQQVDGVDVANGASTVDRRESCLACDADVSPLLAFVDV